MTGSFYAHISNSLREEIESSFNDYDWVIDEHRCTQVTTNTEFKNILHLQYSLQDCIRNNKIL